MLYGFKIIEKKSNTLLKKGKSFQQVKGLAKRSGLLHFHTIPHPPPPTFITPIVIDDSSRKNAAETFTVALTLTVGGYKSAIAPFQQAQVKSIQSINQSINQ